MQTEKGRRNGASSAALLSEGLVNGVLFCAGETNGFMASSTTSPPASPTASASPSGTGSIEHRVSKMDTLAGIAIKYGVEVSDIKRMNGLVTDLQMFAHEKLQIPLPGRHPPSPNLSNGSSNNREQTPPHRCHSDMLDSFQSLKLKPPSQRVTPAMSILQGYYGLTSPKKAKKGASAEGTEMAVYRTGKALNLEDSSLPRASPVSEPPPGRHHKSRSIVNGLHPENESLTRDIIITESPDNGEADRSYSEKSVRRRQKADTDTPFHTPELPKDDGGGIFTGKTGKGLAPRPKSGSRTDLISAWTNPINIGDSFMADGFVAMRKSSSTSNLQDSENSSLWPTTRWTLKTDVISRPIFDGLPKPVNPRRNKAALD